MIISLSEGRDDLPVQCPQGFKFINTVSRCFIILKIFSCTIHIVHITHNKPSTHQFSDTTIGRNP